MPYQSSGGRRNNVQLGVGQSIWAGTPPTAIPERVLDGIPGCLTWMALLLTVVGAVAFPRSLLVIAIVVALYSAFRFLLAGIAAMLGLRTMRQWRKVDWYERYVKTAPPDALAWDDAHHVVIIPNYKEPQPVLGRTLENLAQQYEARHRITIVLAMEAAEDGCIEKANCLHQQFSGKFKHFYHTVHPRGLPGEMQCKSANEAWAARWIKRRLVDELGYDIDHILVTTMDADTLWHRTSSTPSPTCSPSTRIVICASGRGRFATTATCGKSARRCACSTPFRRRWNSAIWAGAGGQ